MDAITKADKARLRELAKRQLECANLPQMQEKQRLWRLHNSLKGERPMVVIEEGTFLSEILPPPTCETPAARRMEAALLQGVTAHALFDDDKAVADFFPVYHDISVDFLGQSPKKTFAKGSVGYHIEPVLEVLEEDLEKLRPSEYVYNEAATCAYAAAAQDTFGDILPVVFKNSFNWWSFGLTQWINNLMGTENLYCAMAAESSLFHCLMRLATDDLIACLRWQERHGLLVRNDGNDYMGGGSFCFGGGLPEPNGQPCVSTDLWGHLNSQETVGVSPSMYAEFIYPYNEALGCVSK